MATLAERFNASFDSGERSRLTGFYGFILFLHIAGWGALLT